MHHNYKILKQNVNKMYRKKSIYLNDQCFFFDITKQACIFYGRCVLLTMLNIHKHCKYRQGGDRANSRDRGQRAWSRGVWMGGGGCLVVFCIRRGCLCDVGSKLCVQSCT